MNPAAVVVDANIAFKALVSHRGDLRDRLDPTTHPRFYTPDYLFVELFKHKKRLAHAARLTEDQLLEALQTLVGRIEFVKEAGIPIGLWMEAYRLCKGVDEHDTPYIALALHLDGRLWTEDGQLKQALRARGFDRFFEP